MRMGLAATLLLLSACGGGAEPPSGAARPPAPGDASPAAVADGSAPFEPDALAHYACQPGTRVALRHDGSASVLLPDGRRYLLDRVADSEPPVYAGHSLFFTVTARAGYLSQEDGARELACTPGPTGPP